MTRNELLRQLKDEIQPTAQEQAMFEARLILKHVLDISDADMITSPDTVVDPPQLDKILEISKRRQGGEPLFRIFGKNEFWGLPFIVTQDVLDPRPDTEVLVETALKWIDDQGRTNEPLRILDLGTGSGCILLALLSELPNAYGVAVDYSYAAAKVAHQNAVQNVLQDRFMVVQSDWMTALNPGTFDLIVSNPPYIRAGDIPKLESGVKNHDPILALSGGIDGMDCYKKIIFSLESHLKAGAHAFLEIGFDQLDDMVRLVDDSMLRLNESISDYGGNLRVVDICCGDK